MIDLLIDVALLAFFVLLAASIAMNVVADNEKRRYYRELRTKLHIDPNDTNL